MTLPRYTCADRGHPTDNYSLICDACAPEYEDDAGKFAATSSHQIFDPPASPAPDVYGGSPLSTETPNDEEHLPVRHVHEEAGEAAQARELPVRDDQGGARA